jgi:hypothetical protein
MRYAADGVGVNGHLRELEPPDAGQKFRYSSAKFSL